MTFKRITWHDDAVAYAEMYGLAKEDCELILTSKSNPTLDTRSHEVGHLIVRYRSGDVVVVVGHRDKDEPVIMSVWVDTKTGHRSGSQKGGGAGSTMPTTMRELKKRIMAAGYRLEYGGSHMKVYDKETGAYLLSLPITPSDHRSIPNAWSLFLRKKTANESEKKEKK